MRSALLLLCARVSTSLRPSGSQPTWTRRALASRTPGVLATLAFPALAAEAPAELKPLYKAAMFARKSRRYAPGERRTPEDFDQGMDSPFAGRFADPNHPDGSRTVTILDQKVGEFRRASITGTDGAGQPPFALPALVYDDQITVDFRPKGGPEGLTGFWATNAIKWPDGNKWPILLN